MRSFAIEEPGSPVPAFYATLPHTQTLADATLRILSGHVAPSTGVEAGDVLPVRHHLRALHLHRRQRRPY